MKTPAVVPWLEANRESLPLGLAVAGGIVLAMLALRLIGVRLSAADPGCNSWKGVIGRVLAKTGVTFMVVAAIEIVLTYAVPPARFAHLVDIAFIIVAALQVAIWARELVLGVVSHRVQDDAESTLGNATAIIRVLVNVAFFAVAFIVILDNLGVNVTALVAGLGIGGIAIGLAAQGIFSDLFAALSILFDRPFRRGDLIRYDQTTGTVERIGLKTTRLRSLTGEQVVMANTKLLEREIHNLAQATARRIAVPFGISYETAHDKLDRIEKIGLAAVSEKGCKPVRCVLASLGSTSVNFELVYDDKATDNDQLAKNRARIMMALVAGIMDAGIAFAVSAPPPAPPGPPDTPAP
jgi:small-conductance mechanosensitive channel